MTKEFNIFGEFNNLEKDYLDSLKQDESTFVEPEEDDLLGKTSDDEDEDEEDLDELIKSKTKDAKELSSKKSQKIEDEGTDEEDEDEDEDSDTSNEDEDDDNVEEGTSSGYSFKALASALADEGVIDFEDSEDEEDSIDVISKAVINTAKNMLDEYKDTLPDVGKQFLTYLEKGGDPKKFIEKTSKTNLLDLDLEDENNQKKIVTELLKRNNYDDDEIQEILEDYDSGLILDKQAKIAHKKLSKILEKEQEDLVAQQEKVVEENRQKYLESVKEIENTILNSKDIVGIKINNADKKALKEYLLSTDKNGVTQYAKDLKEGGVQSQLALAYLQMKKFNFSKFEKEAETKVTKKYKDIFNKKDTTVQGRSKQIKVESKGDLDVFKSFLS